jgi:hypothetical protein
MRAVHNYAYLAPAGAVALVEIPEPGLPGQSQVLVERYLREEARVALRRWMLRIGDSSNSGPGCRKCQSRAASHARSLRLHMG